MFGQDLMIGHLFWSGIDADREHYASNNKKQESEQEMQTKNADTTTKSIRKWRNSVLSMMLRNQASSGSSGDDQSSFNKLSEE